MGKLSCFVVLFLAGTALGQYGGGMDETKRQKICNFRNIPPSCDANSKFRVNDGTCNNLKNPIWGAVFTDYQNWGSSWFGDQVSTFPTMSDGSDLASARVLSLELFGSSSVVDPAYTMALMAFGQFIAHDMSFGIATAPKTCCQGGQSFMIPITCDAIPIPPNDSAYSSVGWNCMDFVRNANDNDLQCDIIPPGQAVKQGSQTTAYLDLSNIYGDTNERATELRAFQGGLMQTVVRNGKEFPPQDPNAHINCLMTDSTDPCYLSSDERLNTNAHLALNQIFWLREHNRLARGLALQNRFWDDERLYQEARRINIAQYQHIVYYEWLPLVLGGMNYMYSSRLAYQRNILLLNTEQFNDYNPEANPGVLNIHANAASRVLHTLISGILQAMDESRAVTKEFKLGETFHQPKLYEANMDGFTIGMVTQKIEKADFNYDTQITDHLFPKNRPMGDDLKALDIQRGRDHGLPKYAEFRLICGTSTRPGKTWDDFLDLISPENVAKLKKMYSSPADVEVVVGLSLENVPSGMLVSPTTRCIFAKQFLLSRTGDRFFFETSRTDTRFSAAQIATIRRASYAKIICNNANNLVNIQPRAFRAVDPIANPLRTCSALKSAFSQIDLSKWKDCSQNLDWFSNMICTSLSALVVP